MAVKRLEALAAGGADVFLRATGLEAGDSLLDCTLGLGADALVGAWATGEQGLVTGLEASPLIAFVTAWGLKNEAGRFDSRKKPLSQLASRINVIGANALDFLRAQSDASWDVLYFDPMFKWQVEGSSNINCMRPFACYEPFGEEALAEAVRVARRRVVLKERWFAKIFERLGANHIVKSKYARLAYGVWESQHKTG